MNSRNRNHGRFCRWTWVLLYCFETIIEPCHDIIARFNLRKLVLQTRMRSQPVEQDVWLLVGLSSTSILRVCEQLMLWQDCADDIIARFNLRKLVLQTRMRSQPVEQDVWLLVGLSSTSILRVCEQLMFCQDCADAHSWDLSKQCRPRSKRLRTAFTHLLSYECFHCS